MLTVAKFGGAGLLMASVFYLVLAGKVDAHEYLTLVLACLGALGVHSYVTSTSASSATTGGGPGGAAPPRP